MSDIPEGIRVGLVGIPGSGIRTLIGALSGTLESAISGVRSWDDTDIQLNAARPDSADLNSLDLLVLVVSARQGVASDNAPVWQKATERGLPAMIVVTHLDDSVADLEEITAMCQRTLSDAGEIFLPALPIYSDDEHVCGFINLLSEEIVDWSDGGPVIRPSEPRHQELIAEARAELCESVMLAVDDDHLFDHYMSGAAIDGETIEQHMFEQILRGLRHPVMGTGISPHLLGVGLLLDVISELDKHRRR